MNFLDELATLFSPVRLLQDPQATGAGISVAIIDSGVERDLISTRHPDHLPILGGIFTAQDPQPRPYQGLQSTPHGTIVADILLTLAPKIQLYSADVFGPAGMCEVEVVIKALQWAVDVWKCKVVNLSLGVTEQRLQTIPKRQQFLRAIENAYYKDVLIFAAAHNDHPLTRSYPAQFGTPLIAVDKQLFADPLEFAYHLSDAIEFQAHSRAYLGPFAHEPATSWASPHLAGIAARILSLKPDLKPFEMKAILFWISQAYSRFEKK